MGGLTGSLATLPDTALQNAETTADSYYSMLFDFGEGTKVEQTIHNQPEGASLVMSKYWVSGSRSGETIYHDSPKPEQFPKALLRLFRKAKKVMADGTGTVLIGKYQGFKATVTVKPTSPPSFPGRVTG